jgi:hypothetical protein
MKRCLLLLIGGTAWLTAGCGIAINTTRNFISEPQIACDSVALDIRCRQWAKDAWKSYAGCHAEVPFSKYFAEGYIDGYADYLRRGGKGDPPAVPKERFRHKEYANYEGYLAIEEWFAGWRVGAADAIASGRRNLILVPVLLPVPPDSPTYGQQAFDPAGSPLAGGAGAGPPPSPEPLPTPRPLTVPESTEKVPGPAEKVPPPAPKTPRKAP